MKFEFFNPNQRREEIDPSLGRIKFSEEERRKMKETGMTEEEIDAKQALANAKLAEKQIEEEQDLAA